MTIQTFAEKLKDAEEINDGLFTIVAQGAYLIEMTCYRRKNVSIFLVALSKRKKECEEYDTYLNSSYVTYEENRHMSDDFELEREFTFNNLSIAYDKYASLIRELNNF